MNDDELLSLIEDIESDRVERKESIVDGGKIRQAICAFANDLAGNKLPGVLVVGVNDKGEPVGTPITDQLLQSLASMRSDGNILPFPALTVQKKSIKGKEVAVVLVEPADAPPVRYKGVVWVRVGPRRGIATPQEERILAERRRYGDHPFDIMPLRDADLDAMDMTLFHDVYLPAAVSDDVLAENRRTSEAQMASLRLVDLGSPVTPTVLGVLVLGKRPTHYLPPAYVSFLRLAGDQLASDVVSSHDIHGPLPRLMAQLDELLRLHIMTAVDVVSGDTEKRIPDYPLAALQQIVRNAIMHRSYEGTNAPTRVYWFSDRIEIINPGGPYGAVTVDNFGQPGITDYRNPNLAEAMRHLGYAQHFGVGIQIAREALARNGNPPLEFKFDAGPVAVIIRKKRGKRAADSG